MEPKPGARISRKAFIQAVVIIFALMIFAGILTRLVPAGQYARIEVDGRQVIDANSFTYIEQPDYPVWRWFTAGSARKVPRPVLIQTRSGEALSLHT